MTAFQFLSLGFLAAYITFGAYIVLKSTGKDPRKANFISGIAVIAVTLCLGLVAVAFYFADTVLNCYLSG